MRPRPELRLSRLPPSISASTHVLRKVGDNGLEIHGNFVAHITTVPYGTSSYISLTPLPWISVIAQRHHGARHWRKKETTSWSPQSHARRRDPRSRARPPTEGINATPPGAPPLFASIHFRGCTGSPVTAPLAREFILA